jgi:hypothetical protein
MLRWMWWPRTLLLQGTSKRPLGLAQEVLQDEQGGCTTLNLGGIEGLDSRLTGSRGIYTSIQERLVASIKMYRRLSCRRFSKVPCEYLRRMN